MKSDSSFQLESANWPAFVVEPGGLIRHANQAAIAFFGPRLEGEGALLSALWAEQSESADHFLVRWERSHSPVVPIKLAGKGGVVTTFAAHICASRDVEHRYIFQLLGDSAQPAEKAPSSDTASLHKQKLECAIQLARSVSLDFNNALTSVLANSSLLLSRMEWDHPWRGAVTDMDKAARKAAEIAQQLAAFSRQEKEVQNHAAGNLNSLLRRVVEGFQPDRPALTWSLQLEAQLYAVKFDDARLRQAFGKIIENAIEATDGSGCIGVSTRNIDLTEPTRDCNARLEPGAYVCIEVTDDGKGMAADVLPRIFEPFFTTKSGHRGLGMAWVYGIITNHRGSLAVSSQPKQWTSVRIYLPASSRESAGGGTNHADLRGGQTILVVDDEELLLSTVQAILSAFGYQVLTATGGLQALDVMARYGPSVDLVITDLVMPQMSGRELIEQLQLRAPGLPVICTSGYARPAGGDEASAWLAKPYTSHQLLSRIKQVLEQAGSG